MKGHENYHLHCRLKELMAQQNLTVDELHQGARVSRETLSQLRLNSFKGVRKQAIARICGAMGIGIGDFFELLPEDIWLPIRLTKEVTIHFGSRTEPEPHPVRAGAASDGDQPAVPGVVGLPDVQVDLRVSRRASSSTFVCASRSTSPDPAAAATRRCKRRRSASSRTATITS